MMATITFEIDAKLKDEAAARLASEGLDFKKAIGLFLHHIAMYGELPFSPERVESERLQKELSELINAKIAAGEINVIKHEVNEKGEWIIDKDKHPELYDWAVNG